ncbi:MAG: hypothetical protein AABZ65_02440 [Candidatus Omnitrophota bacterium]
MLKNTLNYSQKTRKMRKKYVAVIGAISLIITFICQKDALFDRYTINDDVNQYIFPFYAIKDPSLFQNDIFAEYAMKHNTAGTIFVYSLFGIFFDPLALTKILPFILCCLSAIYVFLIGNALYSISVGFLASNIFILYSWTFTYFSGGNPRAFAFPLVLSFIYYLIKRSYVLLGIILIFQVLFYPPVALISILTLIVLIARNIKNSFGKVKLEEENFYKRSYLCCLSMIGSIVLYFLYIKSDNFMGPLVSFKDIITMPEFFSDGRVPFLVNWHRIFTERDVMARMIGMPIDNFLTWFLIGNLFCGLIFILKNKIRVNLILSIFLIASLMMYVLSWLLLFKLFYPGRYLKFSLPIYSIFMSALIINRYVIEKFNYKTFFRLFIVTLSIIIIFLPFLNGDLCTFRNKDLYKFLSTLPKDSLLAAHPSDANEIPLYSKRKVFVQEELSHPFYKNYYLMVSRRTHDFFRLYYSNSIDEAVNICRRYRIDYLVVKKGHFEKKYLYKKDFYFEPFNTKIIHILSENTGNNFIMLNISQEYKVYENDDFIIINCKHLIQNMGECL